MMPTLMPRTTSALLILLQADGGSQMQHDRRADGNRHAPSRIEVTYARMLNTLCTGTSMVPCTVQVPWIGRSYY
ncbi:hypothetical protein C8Q77DRAFT_1134930, partial [Trametes polyzona]